MVFQRLAPAKINLYLDVLNRLENGYHNIESVMQSVSLYDKITLKITDCDGENEIKIASSSDKIPNDNSNLVYKATIKFIEGAFALYGIEIKNKCFDFYIEKSIPVCAGMAGGSADCACALHLLNEAFNYPFKDKELLSLGAKIGADVGFCLTNGTAVCRGIGDKITPISSFDNVYLVCAIDNSGISTPVAFKMLDDKYGTGPSASGSIDSLVDAVEAHNIKGVSNLLFNKFENVIIPLNENVRLIKQTLLENGALGALMSGSGPSVFGIFDNEKAQQNAYKALKLKEIRAFLCKTV